MDFSQIYGGDFVGRFWFRCRNGIDADMDLISIVPYDSTRMASIGEGDFQPQRLSVPSHRKANMPILYDCSLRRPDGGIGLLVLVRISNPHLGIFLPEFPRRLHAVDESPTDLLNALAM